MQDETQKLERGNWVTGNAGRELEVVAVWRLVESLVKDRIDGPVAQL